MSLEKRTHQDNDFWTLVGGIDTSMSERTQIVIGVARSPGFRKAVDWLSDGYIEPAVAEEVKDILIKQTADRLNITVEQSERAFNQCAYTKDEEGQNGK